MGARGRCQWIVARRIRFERCAPMLKLGHDDAELCRQDRLDGGQEAQSSLI